MKRLWPIGIIFSVWLIFASPYFLKGLVPFPSKYLVTFFPPWSAAYGMPVKNNAMPDVITQIYPWKRLTVETWKSGQAPLWNPHSFAGTPHAGNYQSAVFSPVNLLFFVLPEIDAWSLLILLQPLLASLLMYAFLRELNRSPSGSLIGGLAFGYCGFMVVWMAYGTLGYAALPLPLIFLSLHRLFYKPSWWWQVVLSLALAFSFVSGHFQISLYVSAMSAAYLVFLTLNTKKRRVAAWSAFSMVVGLLLASPQLLLSYDAFINSVRQTSFGKGEILPWSYLITIFAPDFYGNPVTRNDWFGHYAEWATFIGVTPVLLTLATIIRKKKGEEWFFWGTAVVALLLALPTPLNDLLYNFRTPVLSTSAAARVVILVSFSLASLSAFGFDGLVKDWKKPRWSGSLRLAIGMGTFLFIIWVLLLAGRVLPTEKLIVAKRNMILPTGLSLTAVALVLVGFTRLPKALVVGGLLAITIFDLLRFAGKWMPFDPREYVYPPMNIISLLKEKVGLDRVFGNFGGELAVSSRIPYIEGYDALYPRRYGEFVASSSRGTLESAGRSVVLLDKAGFFAEDHLQLLGVRYYLHRLSDGRNVWAYPFWNYRHYQSIYRDEYYEVFENTKAYPRAFLASSYIVAENDEEITKLLWRGGINRRQTLVLEKEPSIFPQTGEGLTEIKQYSPSSIVIQTQAASPKLLFLSDTYDAGWRAAVDGQETPVYRADYIFRAVAVPAGVHTIRWYYLPRGIIIGRWLVLLAVAILSFGSLKYFYENRHC